MLITLDDLENNTAETLNTVFKFLGISEYDIKDLSKKNIGKYEKMNPQTKKLLQNFYKPYNEELEILTGRKFNWNDDFCIEDN